MDADREREIRALAEGLLNSKRHGRIALVIRDLLQEIDALRDQSDTETTMDATTAMRVIMEYGEAALAANGCPDISAKEWRDAALKKLRQYPVASPAEVSPSS